MLAAILGVGGLIGAAAFLASRRKGRRSLKYSAHTDDDAFPVITDGRPPNSAVSSTTRISEAETGTPLSEGNSLRVTVASAVAELSESTVFSSRRCEADVAITVVLRRNEANPLRSLGPFHSAPSTAPLPQRPSLSASFSTTSSAASLLHY